MGAQGETDGGHDQARTGQEDAGRTEPDEQDAAAGHKHEAEAAGELFVHAGPGAQPDAGQARS